MILDDGDNEGMACSIVPPVEEVTDSTSNSCPFTFTPCMAIDRIYKLKVNYTRFECSFDFYTRFESSFCLYTRFECSFFLYTRFECSFQLMGVSASSLEDPAKYTAQCNYLKNACNNRIYDQRGELHSKRVKIRTTLETSEDLLRCCH